MFLEGVCGVEEMRESNSPVIISFTYQSFLNILQSIINSFGSAGESIIFQMGKEYGIELCQNALSNMESNDPGLEDLFNYVIAEGSKSGWADMELSDFDPQNGAIEILLKKNIFQPVCISLHQPQCFFLRGFVSGIIKELTNMDYMFFSSQCYSNGDEHCSIRLTTQNM